MTKEADKFLVEARVLRCAVHLFCLNLLFFQQCLVDAVENQDLPSFPFSYHISSWVWLSSSPLLPIFACFLSLQFYSVK